MYVLTIARTESRDRAPQRLRAGFCDSSRKMPLFPWKFYKDMKLDLIEHIPTSILFRESRIFYFPFLTCYLKNKVETTRTAEISTEWIRIPVGVWLAPLILIQGQFKIDLVQGTPVQW